MWGYPKFNIFLLWWSSLIGHIQKKKSIKLWQVPKWICCNLLLWATYVDYKSNITWGQRIGDNLERSYWEHVGEHIGNFIRTKWEPQPKKKKKKKKKKRVSYTLALPSIPSIHPLIGPLWPWMQALWQRP